MKNNISLKRPLWCWIYSIFVFGFIGMMLTPDKPDNTVTLIQMGNIAGFLKGVSVNVALMMFLLGIGLFFYPMSRDAREEPTPASKLSCIFAVPFLMSGAFFLFGFFQETPQFSLLADSLLRQYDAQVFLLRGTGIGMVIAVSVQLLVNKLNDRQRSLKQ